MPCKSFFAHNRLFESREQYAAWTLWRWTTAEDQNAASVSLERCNAESVADCWRLWFSQRDNPRMSLNDLQAALHKVRRAIQNRTTGDLRVELPENRASVCFPSFENVPTPEEIYAAELERRPDLTNRPSRLKSI